MACPQSGIISACDYANFLVSQTPVFDQMIMEDITPTDGWLYNVSTGTMDPGTPAEVTQDRFRGVWPDTTQPWRKVTNSQTGCSGNPCDPPESQIGWGADRLTYYAEEQTWVTPLMCMDQQMHITHAEQHLAQIVSKVLKPATVAISSNFLRKKALQWAKNKWQCNKSMPQFTYQWSLDGTGREAYLDCSANPNQVFKLVPQMLQSRFEPLMRIGYGGENPFKDTSPFIELVTDINTCWELDHLGGQQGYGGGNTPNVLGNWRFEQWSSANKFWRYGFSGQLGNFMVRTDPMGLRFNFLTDLGAGANGGNGNRYRYQVVLPYRNGITSGAGGAAGLGRDENPDFDKAHFRFSYIFHKKAMELGTPDATPLNPEMPYGHRDFGGKWKFLMHDLGEDQNGKAISNKWENKGQFGAWFKYWLRPLHIEFMEVFFHQGEQMCIPEISCCSPDNGYPAQEYNSALPQCPLDSSLIPSPTIPPAGVQPTDTFQTSAQ